MLYYIIIKYYIIYLGIFIFFTYCFRGHDERAKTVFVGLSEKKYV